MDLLSRESPKTANGLEITAAQAIDDQRFVAAAEQMAEESLCRRLNPNSEVISQEGTESEWAADKGFADLLFRSSFGHVLRSVDSVCS